ncbi:MAG: hypothetical protein HRT87_03210 [Legionellales bacterium]|nr:hypothetical protein [Legionellales bacterium]
MRYLLSLIIYGCLYLNAYAECPIFSNPYDFFDWNRHALEFKDGMFKHCDENKMCDHIQYSFAPLQEYSLQQINDNSQNPIDAFNIFKPNSGKIFPVVRYAEDGLSSSSYGFQSTIKFIENQSTNKNCVYEVTFPIHSVEKLYSEPNVVGLRILKFNVPINDSSCTIL